MSEKNQPVLPWRRKGNRQAFVMPRTVDICSAAMKTPLSHQISGSNCSHNRCIAAAAVALRKVTCATGFPKQVSISTCHTKCQGNAGSVTKADHDNVLLAFSSMSNVLLE